MRVRRRPADQLQLGLSCALVPSSCGKRGTNCRIREEAHSRVTSDKRATAFLFTTHLCLELHRDLWCLDRCLPKARLDAVPDIHMPCACMSCVCARHVYGSTARLDAVPDGGGTPCLAAAFDLVLLVLCPSLPLDIQSRHAI